MKFALALAALVFAGPAAAEELTWFASQFDRTTALVYGVPESDYTPLVFSCELGDAEVGFYFGHEAPDAADGQQMAISFSAGNASVETMATGSFQEIDDLFHLEGLIKLDRRLVGILSSGSPLTVAVEGTAQEFPVDGLAENLDVLVAACGAPLGPLDLELRLTNNSTLPIVSFLFSEKGVNDFDGDTYGNHVLAPGDVTYVVIPNGKQICSFDMRSEFDEDAERDPVDTTQNLCDNPEVVVGE